MRWGKIGEGGKAAGWALLGFLGGAGGDPRVPVPEEEGQLWPGRAEGDRSASPQHLSGTSTSIDIDVTTLELMAAAWSSLLIVFVFG